MHQNVMKTILAVVGIAAVLAGSANAQIINTLRGFDDKEKGWSGAIAGAIAFAEGNTEYFEFEVNGKVQYQTERHRWRGIGINMRRTALGEEIAEARLGHFRHNYRLWPRVSTIAFLQGQYNPFLRVESRILIGAGGRAELFQGEVWRSAIGIAIMHETEKLTGGAETDSLLEPEPARTNYRFSYFVTLYRAGVKGFDIDLWGFYQPLIDDLTDARASGAVGIRMNLVGELDFLVSYLVRYDSDPPTGVKKQDYMLRSGLGWEF